MEPKEDHWILRLLLIIILPIPFYYVAITHRFGPYQGMVFDGETGEPIEGAVVLVAFHTDLYSLPGGPRSRFVDAVEVLTDSKGEFKIDHRCWVMRFPHRWDPYCSVTIYKPGYGCFPDHKDSYPKYCLGGCIPTDQYVLVGLPRPKTKAERWGLNCKPSVPEEKMKALRGLLEIEDRELGVRPRLGSPMASPAWPKALTVKSVGSDCREARLVYRATGTEWLVTAGDRVGEWHISEVSCQRITLTRKVDENNLVAMQLSVPIVLRPTPELRQVGPQ